MEYYVIMVTKIDEDSQKLHSSTTYHVNSYGYWQIKKILKQQESRINDQPDDEK